MRPTILLLILALVPTAVAVAGSSYGPEDTDPLVERIRIRLDHGEYRSVADSLDYHMGAAKAAGDSVRLARLICARGQSELGLGQIDPSLVSLDTARRMAQQLGDTNTVLLALGVRAFALSAQGRFDEVIGGAPQRIEIARGVGDLRSEGVTHLSVGYAEISRGNLEPADSAYERAIEIFDRAELPRWRITALTGLGRVATQRGELAAARRIFDAIIQSSRALGDRRNEIDATNNLGVIEYEHGDLELAVRYLQRAYGLQLEEDDRAGAIYVMNNAAFMYRVLGQEQEARRILEESIEIASNGGHLVGVLNSRFRLAELELAVDRPRAAVDALLGHSGSYPNPTSRVRAAILLARCWLVLNEPARALAALEEIREPLPQSGDWNLVDEAVTRSRAYAEMGRLPEALTLLESRLDVARSSRWAVICLAEYAKRLAQAGKSESAVLSLRESLSHLETERMQLEDEMFRERYGSQASHLIDATWEILRAPGGQHPMSDADVFEVLQRTRARTLLERLRANEPLDMLQSNLLSLEELQTGVLESGDLLLDFHPGQKRVLLLAISKDRVDLIPLDTSRGELLARSRRLRELVRNPGLTESTAPFAQSLAAVLLGDAAESCRGARRILLCPADFAAVPFELFPVGEGGTPLALASTVVRLPSISILPQLRRADARRSGVATLSSLDEMLPGAQREIRDLKRSYHGVRAIDGLAFARRETELDASILHVAAHADVGAQAWHTGIRLRGDAEIDSSDGLLESSHLRAKEILEFDLDVDLVVLAACQSNLGRVLVAEGVLGLTSAFLVANTSTVVSTLWPVDDGATSRLMNLFYDRLADGQNVSESLQGAQRTLRANPATAHPYYWAGFVVSGRPDVRVQLRRRFDPSPFGIVVTIAGLGWLVVWGLARRERSRELDR